MKMTILFAKEDDYIDYMVFVSTLYRCYSIGIQADGYVHKIKVFNSKEDGNEYFKSYLNDPDFKVYRKGTDSEIEAIRPYIIEKVKEQVLKEFLG